MAVQVTDHERVVIVTGLIKFLPDFHNSIELNELVNSFSLCSITSPNKMSLGCKLHWSAKRNYHVRSNRLEVFCKKALLKISQNSENAESFSNNVIGLQVVFFITNWLQHRCFPMNFTIFYEHLFDRIGSAFCVYLWILKSFSEHFF